MSYQVECVLPVSESRELHAHPQFSCHPVYNSNFDGVVAVEWEEAPTMQVLSRIHYDWAVQCVVGPLRRWSSNTEWIWMQIMGILYIYIPCSLRVPIRLTEGMIFVGFLWINALILRSVATYSDH